MPAPKYENWFMEGRLIPDHHYIQIRDDYTDLEEKLQYYIEHTAKAQAIINTANAYVKQFFDKKQEDLISLLVLERYFYYTSQKDTLVVL
jgi:RNase adaptor protein for sRNA GlmZ degradation